MMEMTKIEITVWELAQLYDFYQKISRFRTKGKLSGLKVKEPSSEYSSRRISRKKNFKNILDRPCRQNRPIVPEEMTMHDIQR